MEPCPGIKVSKVRSDAQSAIEDPAEGDIGACICVPSGQYNITCPPGYYCPPEGGQYACTEGFYCPGNTTQATYCCQGHYCSHDTIEMFICPEGHFCPNGVKEAISCPPLSVCEEGATEVRSGGPLLAIIVIFIILYLLYTCLSYKYKSKEERHEEHVREFSRKAELETEAEHDLSVLRSEQEKKEDAVVEVVPQGQPPVDSKEDGEQGLEIVFKDIWFVLPNGRVLMKAVNGIFRRGRSMAVMGPSGAGKSTLFSLVMGKAKRTRGTIEINGKQDELYNYSDLIGFVPQEDVMLRMLTTYDILKFSADYRLPASKTSEERRNAVLEALNFLEIDHVVNSVIGDEKRRGVSGGQRKRVNIGMELVAAPKVLFLDEPTSGLDAVTSFTLAALLRDLARTKGISVAAVIHSPSQATFEMFDDLTLLGAGGQMIYQGPVNAAPEYFSSIGFPVPEDVNPADFYLEVAMGKVEQKNTLKVIMEDGETQVGSETKEVIDGMGADKNEKSFDMDGIGTGRDRTGFDPTELFSLWRTKGEAFRSGSLKKLPDPDMEEKVKGDDQLVDIKPAPGCFELAFQQTKAYWLEVWEEFYNFLTCSDPKKARQTPNGFRIYYWCCKRTYQQLYRDGYWMLGLFMHVGLGLFCSVMGTSFFIGPLPTNVCETAPTQQVQSCTQSLNNPFLGIGTFTSWAVLFAGMVEGINTFGLEQVVFWRHSSHGLPLIPYFAAKVTMDAPRMVLDALFFFWGLTSGYTSMGNDGYLFAFILLNYWVGYSMGYFISVTAEPRNRSLYCVLFSMMWTVVFSGGVVLLTEIDDQYEGLTWIWDISPTRWGVEAFFLNEVSFYEYMVGVVRIYSVYGYNEDNLPKDFGIMFALGWFWQFITFILMKLLNRDQQK
mmetsp:Transcript_28294/g.39343  ORF Transcript_28294/g.39343 Transcript_28294/m.39343 type:complete len:888 (-) Transcript_28294:290-2953(-)